MEIEQTKAQIRFSSLYVDEGNASFSYLLSIGATFNIIIDAGWQPNFPRESLPAFPDNIEVDAILISSAAYSAIGALPIAYRKYKAPIYSTLPGCKIGLVALLEAYISNRNITKACPTDSLYSHDDINEVTENFHSMSLNCPVFIKKNSETLSFTFQPSSYSITSSLISIVWNGSPVLAYAPSFALKQNFSPFFSSPLFPSDDRVTSLEKLFSASYLTAINPRASRKTEYKIAESSFTFLEIVRKSLKRNVLIPADYDDAFFTLCLLSSNFPKTNIVFYSNLPKTALSRYEAFLDWSDANPNFNNIHVAHKLTNPGRGLKALDSIPYPRIIVAIGTPEWGPFSEVLTTLNSSDSLIIPKNFNSFRDVLNNNALTRLSEGATKVEIPVATYCDLNSEEMAEWSKTRSEKIAAARSEEVEESESESESEEAVVIDSFWNENAMNIQQKLKKMLHGEETDALCLTHCKLSQKKTETFGATRSSRSYYAYANHLKMPNRYVQFPLDDFGLIEDFVIPEEEIDISEEEDEMLPETSVQFSAELNIEERTDPHFAFEPQKLVKIDYVELELNCEVFSLDLGPMASQAELRNFASKFAGSKLILMNPEPEIEGLIPKDSKYETVSITGTDMSFSIVSLNRAETLTADLNKNLVDSLHWSTLNGVRVASIQCRLDEDGVLVPAESGSRTTSQIYSEPTLEALGEHFKSNTKFRVLLNNDRYLIANNVSIQKVSETETQIQASLTDNYLAIRDELEKLYQTI